MPVQHLEHYLAGAGLRVHVFYYLLFYTHTGFLIYH